MRPLIEAMKLTPKLVKIIYSTSQEMRLLRPMQTSRWPGSFVSNFDLKCQIWNYENSTFLIWRQEIYLCWEGKHFICVSIISRANSLAVTVKFANFEPSWARVRCPPPRPSGLLLQYDDDYLLQLNGGRSSSFWQVWSRKPPGPCFVSKSSRFPSSRSHWGGQWLYWVVLPIHDICHYAIIIMSGAASA